MALESLEVYLGTLGAIAIVWVISLICALKLILSFLADRPDWRPFALALASITLAGLTARLAYRAVDPILESNLSWMRLLDTFHVSQFLQFGTPSNYPQASSILAAPLFLVFDPSRDILQYLNICYSTLMIPAVAGLVLGYEPKSRVGALVAAALFAFAPVQIKFAGTESNVIPYALFSLLALVSAFAYRRTHNWRILVFALASTLLALSCRWEGLIILLPMFAAAFLPLEDRTPAVPLKTVALGLGIVGVLMVPHILQLLNQVSGPSEPAMAMEVMLESWLWTALLLLPFGIVVVYAMFRARLWLAVFAGLAVLVVMSIHGYMRWGIGFFSPWPLEYDLYMAGDSYATYHVCVFNPKCFVPAVVPLAIIGCFAILKKEQLAASLHLAVWFVAGMFVSNIKGTGGVPFFGMRGAQMAIVPFLALGGIAVERLTQRIKARWVVVAAFCAVSAGALPFYHTFLTDTSFLPVMESKLLSRNLWKVPDNSTILVPSGPFPFAEGKVVLPTTGHMVGGLVVEQNRNISVQTTGTNPQEMSQFTGDVYLFTGGDCFRNGLAADMNNFCTRPLEFYELELVDEKYADVRPMRLAWSDEAGIEEEYVPIRLYRVLGTRPPEAKATSASGLQSTGTPNHASRLNAAWMASGRSPLR